MSSRAGERAQSIQIGAVLLFGVLIILLASYQAFVVPNQNRQVEANHVDTITQQMQELRNAVVSVPSTHTGRSVTLALGVSYSPRVVAVNPPDPTGAIRTVGTATDDVNLTVANAVAPDDEIGDRWNGTNQTYSTGGMVYEPGYNEYGGAPTVVYENTLLYHRFRTGNLTRAGQRLVDGRRLTLVALNGSFDTAASGAVSVDLDAVSASSRQITVTNEAGQNVTFDVASQYNASQWEAELREDGEFTDQGGHVAGVTDTPIAGSPFQVVHVELERGETYLLRMAKVGVGTGVAGESEAYLTDVDGDGETVEQGQNRTLVVEARDRFNNPVSGVQVNATAESGTIPDADVTEEDGQASFEYQAPSGTTGQVAVNFSYAVVPGAGFDADAPENVTMTVTVEGAGGASGDLVYDGSAEAHDGPDPNDAPGGMNVTVENTHGSTVTITDVEVKPDDGAIDVLADRVTGIGIASHELYVAADQADGHVDFSGPPFDDGPSGGTTVPQEINVNSDGHENNGDPQVSSGATATLYLYEFFTGTDDAANVDMSGETLDVTISYRVATGQAFQTQFSATPTSSGTGSAPAASVDAIDDQSTDCDRNPGGNCRGGSTATTEFVVDYSGTDADGDLTELSVELIDPDGNLVDSATNTYSDVSSASETDTLTHDHTAYWTDAYTVRVTATDANGNTDVVDQTEDADGN